MKPKAVRLEEVTEAERARFHANEALYEQKFTKDKSTTVGELVKTKIAKLGENINISRFDFYEAAGNGVVGHYIHTGAQIGVLLEVNSGHERDSGERRIQDAGARYRDAGGGGASAVCEQRASAGGADRERA